MAGEMVIGDVACAPGAVSRGTVSVAAGAGLGEFGFPVLVVNGIRPGPRLCVVAGVHGDEYEGMEAVRRVLRETDPATLRGALVGIPCLNLAAFETATRSSSVDGANLNRIFPGDAAGSLSLRLAATFLRVVVPEVDALLDLHTGGGFGEIAPVTIVQSGFEKLAMGLGQAIGHELLWMGGKWSGTARISALEAGKAAVTVEAGGGGGCREETIAAHVGGVRSAMQYLRMIEGAPAMRREYRIVSGTFDRAATGGFFLGRACPGAPCRAGEPVGVIVNHFGDERQVIKAPHDGIVLWVRRRASIQPGEETVIFGRVERVVAP
jgi:predicted deacylase